MLAFHSPTVTTLHLTFSHNNKGTLYEQLNLIEPIEKDNNYKNIARAGSYKIQLDVIDVCTVLKAYDDGIDTLNPEELHGLDMVIAKLKDEIWP